MNYIDNLFSFCQPPCEEQLEVNNLSLINFNQSDQNNYSNSNTNLTRATIASNNNNKIDSKDDFRGSINDVLNKIKNKQFINKKSIDNKTKSDSNDELKKTELKNNINIFTSE